MKFLWIGALLAASVTAEAGWFDRGTNVDVSEQLSKLFGANTAFTATAQVSVTGRVGQNKQAAEIEYAYLDGKMRAEINMAKTKAGQKHAEAMDQMAMMGMDRMVNLIVPDKKKAYVIYPGLRSYCEMPTTTPTGQAGTPPTVTRKELGREMVEGHPSIKTLVTITEANGQKYEVTSWEATDLNNFPVKCELQQGGDTVVTIFKNIKLDKPAVSLFEVPANFKQYSSIDEMMMGAVQQMIGK